MISLRPRMLSACIVTLFALPLWAQTGSISGRVRDAAAGQPILGARVQAITASGTVVRSVLASDDGSYRLADLGAESYAVVATRIGYQSKRIANVAVTAGSTTTLDIELSAVLSQLDQVVTTASKKPEKVIDAPASISVITAAQVEQMPAPTVVGQLHGLPGVDVASGGILQANYVARGFNNVFSGALLTLVDNRYAFVPSLAVNVPYMNPGTSEDIDRIELVLGPGSALYGPNASNGVMAVYTKSPFDSRGTTVTMDGGSRSYFRGALRHAGAPNEKFGYKFSFDYLTAEDWHSSDAVEDSLGVVRDFGLRRLGGEARIDIRPDDRSEIIATYGHALVGRAIEPTGLGAAQVRDWTFRAYQLRARRDRLFGQLFLNTSDAGETFLLRNALDADGGRIVDKSQQLVGQLQHGFNLGSRQDFIYGFDYISTNPRTEGTINGRNENRDNTTIYGGYLQSTTALSNQFDLIAAARYDKHSRLEDGVFSPRAGLVFKPVENHNFRVTYNRAFNTPSTNNLSLDLKAGQIVIPGTPGYPVRALGVPTGGLQFKRDCTGGVDNYCMRSPFVPGSPYQPAMAAPLYQAAVAAVVAGGLQAKLQAAFQAQGMPAAQAAGAAQAVVATVQASNPGATEVGTQFRALNPTTQTFVDVAPSELRDVAEMKPTLSNGYEVGYKGIIGKKLRLQVDFWQQDRKNFVGPLIVETPNVFLDRASLTTFLTGRLTPVLGASAGVVAAQIATGMAGVSGGTSAEGTTGVPLGVVNFNQELNDPTDIILTYRNFGDVKVWGADVGADVLINDYWTVSGTYSHVNKDFFSKSDIGGVSDVALNAPKAKGSLAVRYNDEPRGVSGMIRGRSVGTFPVNSGVYIGDVPKYNLLDLEFAFRPAFLQGAMWSLMVQNALDERHIEFAGGATLGRMLITRLQYKF